MNTTVVRKNEEESTCKVSPSEIVRLIEDLPQPLTSQSIELFLSNIAAIFSASYASGAVVVAVAEVAERRPEEWHKASIVIADEVAESLLGWTREELTGLELSRIFADGQVEELSRSFRKPDRAAKKKGCLYTLPPRLVRLLSKGNAEKTVRLRLSVVSHDLLPMLPVLVTAVAYESTEILEDRHQYKRLLSFLDTMDYAFIRTDAEGRMLATSEAETRITGYSVGELWDIRRQDLLVHRESRQEMLHIARSQGGKITRHLVQIRGKDGRVIWAEEDLRIVHDAEGREIGTESLYRDVTQRVLLQRALGQEQPHLLEDEQLYRLLVREAEFQLDFQSSFGHQVETVLSAILGTLENLRVGLLKRDDFEQRLKWLSGQLRVCTGLVTNLSFLDRTLRGEPPCVKPMSWRKLAVEVSIDFEHLVEEKQLTVSVDGVALDRHLPDHGDPNLLRQALVNLLDNAIKYSQPGSVIRIGALRRTEGRVLQVTNKGIPISVEDRERIFERRYRAKAARNLIPHGTGLGLWLVRKIVEGHGAVIRCLEVSEGGEARTAFRVTFPHSRIKIDSHAH